MRELLLTMLSLSLSGGLLALLLFAVRPFTRRFASFRWQYFIWLLVLIRLLLPFGPEISLMQTAGNQLSTLITAASASAGSTGAEFAPEPAAAPTSEAIWTPATNEDDFTPVPADALAIDPNPATTLNPVAWLTAIWLVAAALLLLRKIVFYNGLQREIKSRSSRCESLEVNQLTTELCQELKINRPPPVYLSHQAPSPMLVGVRRQFIVLPTDCCHNPQLRFILLHELVHLKRRDIFYKWLTQLVVCLHWFNPLVYLVQREIDRNCELACDEVVLRKVSLTERICYGQAILSVIRPARTMASSGLSLSLNEDTALIKERLEAIMKQKRTPKWTLCLTVILTFALLSGATYAGAYTPHRLSKDTLSVRQSPLSSDLALKTATIHGETWYLLSTEAELRGLSTGQLPLDGKYLLNDDINLTKEIDWIRVGTRENPFTGTFNGNGCEIRNLTISDPAVNVIGMFAYAENAKIYNVTLKHPDIERAFTHGNTIAPVLAIGINTTSFDHQIIESQEKDDDHLSRPDSLVQAFAPYESFGVTYDATTDKAYYNGIEVKLFVTYHAAPLESMTYAFELCYQDQSADHDLYLEAVRSSDGTISGIKVMDPAVALDIMESMGGLGGLGDTSEADNQKPRDIFMVTMDATTTLESHGITAQDLTIAAADQSVQRWVSSLHQPGAYVRSTHSANQSLTYIYYNGGGRYPWNITVENGQVRIDMYSDSHLVTSDGYYLMYFTAPQDYPDIRLYLDGEEIKIND